MPVATYGHAAVTRDIAVLIGQAVVVAFVTWFIVTLVLMAGAQMVDR